MTPKVWVLFAFCAIQLGCGSAKAPKCNYGYSSYEVDGSNVNYLAYSCTLNTKRMSFNENATRIGGQHEREQIDADVKNLYVPNLLRHFSPIFCQKFPNLEVIFTENAQIESIDGSAFDNCLGLQHLNLTGNQFEELPEELLSRNLKLERIFISNSQLKSLPEKFFIHQNNLLYLSLKENQLDLLPSRIFDALVKLQILYIQGNNLQSIDPKWFKNLQNLKELGLGSNQITELPAEVFKPLRNLEELYLYSNRINVLSSTAFEGLQNLQSLMIYQNEISELPTNIFADLINLNELDLSDNKLTTIHSDSFGSINKITKLWLKNNKISSVDSKFIDVQKFTYFNFQNNTCSDFFATNNSQIKQNLQQCFENYQSRV